MDLHEKIAELRASLDTPSPQSGIYVQLGDAYSDLARQTNQIETWHLALEAYQAASGRISTGSVDFLMVQNSLGNTYWQLAQLENRNINIQNAIAAYRHALRYCDPAQAPLAYATLHNNLGNIYASLEDRHSLHKAFESYQETLLHVDAKTPAYATLQNNLGNVCRRLAVFENREINLQRALTAYKEALRIFSPVTAPLPYATLQANMGLVYEQMGDLHEAALSWKEAAAVASTAGAAEEAAYFAELAEKTLAQLEDRNSHAD